MYERRYPMKNKIGSIISVILIFIIAYFSVAPLEEAEVGDGRRWMAALDDSTPINQLSIPGTHDSGATHSIGDVTGKCQSLGIEDQLKIGVRFLDIRLQLVGDDLRIVHSFMDQGTDFDDTLEDIVEFIEENPTEFLFISIKKDADSKRPAGDFARLLEDELREYDIISDATTLPSSVGEARGKIYIISRYEGSTMGIPAYEGWQDSTSFELGELYAQDNYAVDSAEIKKADIKATFGVSAEGQHGLVLNFTSCYLTSVFPPTYAATPAKEINPWIRQELHYHTEPLGVMVCDFVTTELVKSIWEVNFR